MTRYLLDTNAVADLFNRRFHVHERAEEARLRGDVQGTSEPVVAELYFGVENSASADSNRASLERGLARLRVWPHDRAASREFGRVAARLRRAGRTIGALNMLTASIALTFGCVVVSHDSDFRLVGGLVVEDWRS